MTDQCVVARYSDPENFNTAIEVLEKAGFSPEEVSLVRNRDDVDQGLPCFATKPLSKQTSLPNGPTTTSASLMGGTIGAAMGAATMIGPMLVAGPLVGMAAGAAAGGTVNIFQTVGASDDDAADYHEAIANGDSLIVICGDPVRLQKAHRVLKTVSCVSLARHGQ
ncbi:DUF1269 domain-containing protein [Stieleria sp. JC731]|uniref:DUF1269 domain-containing protein n=1 Tax=Pirellulaceae TaxID=2691357 RepID=UPI001E6066E1|nr:DUF1269 domain-containing protein [Stieleria sp. JC731]MCC9602075.1 DUF1269 domain-containing protein [Stieleria sp. JC731]